MGKSVDENISKSWNSKYSQKLLDHAKQSAIDAFKTSKRVIQTAEATSDLIENKIADKVTRSSKASRQNNLETNEEILREKYMSPELRQKNSDDLNYKLK